MITGTVQVTGPIAPTDPADVYPTHEDSWGKGGYIVVADIAARNAIPTERKKAFMSVRTANDGAWYQLEGDLTTWTNIPTSVGDMLKATYDTNNDGVVDDAEHAVEADHALLADNATTANSATTAGTATFANAAAQANDALLLNGQPDTFYLDRTNHSGTQGQATIVNLISDLASKENKAEKDQISGYCGLDGGGKIPAANIDPATIDHDQLLNYDPAAHYLINDSGNSTTDLFSADKILSLIAAVTGMSSSIIKESVQTASYTNVNPLSGLGLYNGHTMLDGERIGLGGQANPVENGIWEAHAGAWTRPASDWNTGDSIVSGTTFFVDAADSTVVGDQLLVTTPGPSIVDTDIINFVRVRRLTLGTGAGQACAGNDARIPTQNENDALQGTNGAPSNANRYVTNSDPRNTDSRTPSGAAAGDLTGTYPAPTIAALAVTDAKVAAANKDGVAGTPSMRTLGSGAQQACAGNDARLTNSRPPNGAAGGDLGGTYPNPTVVDLTISGESQGDVLYFNGTNWVRLPAGTSGLFLKTLGAGNNPVWDAPAITGVAVGGDLSGTLPNPTVVDLTITGEVHGDILYRNATNWVKLAAGTAGHLLQTNGAGAAPSWVAPPAGGGSPVPYTVAIKVANYTILNDDNCIAANAAGLVFSLPAAATFSSAHPVTIKDITGNAFAVPHVINCNGGDTFDDSSPSKSIVTDNGWLTFASDGISKWLVISQY